MCAVLLWYATPIYLAERRKQIMGGRYLLTITFRRGTDLKEAIKYMNTLAKCLKRRMKNDINFEMLICVSDVTGKYGEYMTIKTGKIGRPRREYVGTTNAQHIDKREPHIHILLHGRDTNKIKNYIYEHYSARRDITDTFDYSNCDFRWGSSITYVIRQTKKRRYLVSGDEIESPLRRWELRKYCRT